MYLKFALATILTTASPILAIPQSPWLLGYAQCLSLDECSWVYSNGNYHCVCDYCPTTDYNDPYLASFFTGSNFKGSELKTYGPYGECVNLPAVWTQQLNSMESNTNPADICCVFTATNCNIQHAFTTAAASIAQLIGDYKDGIRSLVCSRWVNEQSTCAPWVPSSPPNTLYVRETERFAG
ncbi:uncharacterized protein K444DRAFT_624137 [Hyaloscypha bicolor E]|uniref:Uncharacterized protein n=1 Tax=Hyaloscypha bicolor E TaxID=1095630 RepID=A0A2J6TUL4_9HELO|nr:uncharacterized protein K444DRAFT_624137 [Hyaloscypha bicolor E]PMD66648.1 hypothetical protein K444DRAFT_624137 [Hyaloscypha bicolor E]